MNGVRTGPSETAMHHGAGGVPGVRSGPTLTVQQAQFVVHRTLAHDFLVFTWQIAEHSVNGGNL